VNPSRESAERVKLGSGASPPKPSSRRLRLLCRSEQAISEPPAVAMEEPHARRSLPDEHEIDVLPPLEQVNELSPEAVARVQSWVGCDANRRPRRKDALQRPSRRSLVALSSRQFGSIDLDEAKASAAFEPNGVTVDNRCHCGGRWRRWWLLRGRRPFLAGCLVRRRCRLFGCFRLGRSLIVA
jgi:hypothetical protein